jgi:hypothetical protein
MLFVNRLEIKNNRGIHSESIEINWLEYKFKIIISLIEQFELSDVIK